MRRTAPIAQLRLHLLKFRRSKLAELWEPYGYLYFLDALLPSRPTCCWTPAAELNIALRDFIWYY